MEQKKPIENNNGKKQYKYIIILGIRFWDEVASRIVLILLSFNVITDIVRSSACAKDNISAITNTVALIHLFDSTEFKFQRDQSQN